MIGIYRTLLVLSVVVHSSTICIAADDLPLKPKVINRLDLPYLVDGATALSGWVGFSPTNEYVAAYYSTRDSFEWKNSHVELKNSYLAIWETAKGTLIEKIMVDSGMPGGYYGPPAIFTDNGKYLVYATRDDVRFYSMAPSHETQTIQFVSGGVWNPSDLLKGTCLLGSDPTNKVIKRTVFCSDIQYLTIDDIQLEPKPKLSKIRDTRHLFATMFAIAHDHTLMAWTEEDPGKIFVKKMDRDKTTETEIKKLIVPKPAREISVLAFNRKNSLLASGSRDGTFIIWDLQTASVKALIRDSIDHKTISSVAFSLDGLWAAYSNTNGKGISNVRVASIQTGKTYWELSDNPIGVSRIAFSSTGQNLAVLGSTTVNIYDVTEQKK